MEESRYLLHTTQQVIKMSRVKGWGTGLGGGRWLGNTPSHEGPALGVVVARKHARRRRRHTA